MTSSLDPGSFLERFAHYDFEGLDELSVDAPGLLGHVARVGHVMRDDLRQKATREEGIQAILNTMMEIAAGDFDVEVPFDRNDELLDALMVGMNMMAEELAVVTTQYQMARDEALQASAIKSQFLASMSHELRTPLNAVIGYAELVKEDAELDGHDQIADDAEKILAASRHLLSLISDILDLSKIEAGKIELSLETFPLESMCHELHVTLAPLINERGNELILDFQDAAGLLTSDRMRLQQVLLNLLSNANKFTSQGTIRFAVARQIEDHTVSFTIQDSGVGIAAGRLDAIFEPFVQEDGSTTRKFGGTGLGLAISKKLAHMLGGDISVESTPGKGSSFTVTVTDMLEQDTGHHAASQVSEVSLRQHTAQSGALDVVLIDDDPNVHELMRRSLPSDNVAVSSFFHGVNALKSLIAREKLPDMIFLDIQLPEIDGWTILAHLRKDARYKDVPISIISIVDNRTLGFALGADEYFIKPLNYSHLLALLIDKCARGSDCNRILVVDDDRTARDLARRALEPSGYTVFEASDGHAALKFLEASKPDLILLDLMMPGIDGFELFDRLQAREAWRDIPVVVLSAMDLSQNQRTQLQDQLILKKDGSSYAQLYEVLTRAMSFNEDAPSMA
jgi:signal transduction histidine kinase/CheY-like chemotaxis protein